MAKRSFISERIHSLKPTYDPATNPLRLLRLLSKNQWGFFFVGFLAWTWDAFDFYTVALTYTSLGNTFHKDLIQIALAVTLVLMFRPLGAALFGLAADRVGRKWPFIINNILLIIFELATGFCRTYEQFLAVRALFGIAMGGIYGNATTTALEDCPEEARGLLSGIFQSGYPFGFLLATIFWEAFNGRTPYEWRPLFWFGAGFPVLLIISRLFMPETDKYNNRRAARPEGNSVEGILVEAREGLKKHWLLLIYLVLLMSGFGFMSHGTQDLYYLMLSTQYYYSSNDITIILVMAYLGGVLGGTIGGYCSQIFGRRFSIIVLCVIGGALLYPYTLVSGPGIYASAFFEQFCVQGVFGIIPIHLVELSPPAFNTFIVGTSYNLGILISSPSIIIEVKIGDRYPLEPTGNDYGLAICLFAAGIFAYAIIVTILGPEQRGRRVTDHDSDDNDREEGHEHHPNDRALWVIRPKGRY